MSILKTENLTYHYSKDYPILKGMSVSFERGKTYAILGASGSGKTTLLSLLGGLDTPVEGKIYFDGNDICKIGYEAYRRNCVAFIFQNYNLIDYMTPAENVRLTFKGDPLPFLAQVGISAEEARRSVLKLSGGQQQRVAIARALAADAPVILADEPTGNIDDTTARNIFSLLIENAREYNKCVIIVTHSQEFAKYADVTFILKDGALIRQ